MARGRAVAQGTADELRSRYPVRHRLVLGDDAAWVRAHPGVRVVALDGTTALLEITDRGAEQALLIEALSRTQVLEFATVIPQLSELYREVAA